MEESNDPNNNYYEVGRTTSDASGFYSVAFTPDVPGKYTIVVTFAGSESYYSSSAETAINIINAPATTVSATPATQSTAEMYFVPAIAGIFVLIIIVLAIQVFMMIEKRP